MAIGRACQEVNAVCRYSCKRWTESLCPSKIPSIVVAPIQSMMWRGDGPTWVERPAQKNSPLPNARSWPGCPTGTAAIRGIGCRSPSSVETFRVTPCSPPLRAFAHAGECGARLGDHLGCIECHELAATLEDATVDQDQKSTRLNSSHTV